MMLLRGIVPVLLAFWAPAVAAAGDAGRGARLFQNCAACHSVAPAVHMTGPSLSGVWQRRAGSAEGFARYSEALKRSGAVWNEAALDAWLRNPAAFAPGNFMNVPGIAEARARSDLIAYLRAISGRVPPKRPGAPSLRSTFPDLRRASPDVSVHSPLRGYLLGNHSVRQGASLLGIQSALQDRFLRPRSGARQAGDGGGRIDGRPGAGGVCRARRDLEVHQDQMRVSHVA